MKLLYRIDEVAKEFSISTRGVYRLIDEGKLDTVNDSPGKKGLRVTGISMLRYIEVNMNRSSNQTSSLLQNSPPRRKIISKGIE